MSLPAYPAYKDSGVEWLGEVPAHWEVMQSRRMFSVRSEPALSDDQMLTASQKYGVLLQSEFVEREGRRVVEVIMGKESLKHVEPDDFIISMRSFQGGLEWCRQRGSTSFHYVMVAPIKHVHPPFFAHLFKCIPYIHALRATTDLIRDGQELRYSNFVQVPLPVIPIPEQAAIATFLDRETGKIDALVGEQRRLIALLKEKRQAVISHVVTKGLNPHAPLKPSGTEWLGDVPAHWTVVTLRRVIEAIGQGWSPQCDSEPAQRGQWGVLKTGCVNHGVFRPEENKALPSTLEVPFELAVRSGDVLMSRASGTPSLVGSTAYVDATPGNLLLSDKIFRLHLCHGLDPRWFALLMNAQCMRVQIEGAISGADGLANNLPQAALKSFYCAVPPKEEQLQQVDRIINETGRLDELITAAHMGITLLQERRSALISAAVTGKIDLRGLMEAQALETAA